MEKITKEELLSFLNNHFKDAKCALNYYDDYSLLISIILSAQTTDKSVNNVTKILFNKYKNFSELSKADTTEVESIIKQIGLYHNKAKNIIEASKIIVREYSSVVPSNFDDLIKITGVGRKTANVFLAEYFDKDTLGVDTHINRVSKRLKIAKENDNVIVVENKLHKFISGENTKKMHHMLIAFGRNICTAKNPKCELCSLNNKCDYYKKILK